MRRHTAFVLAVLSCASIARAQMVTYVNDPLTAAPRGAQPGVTAGVRGGRFDASGWTTSGDTDSLWYTIPATLPRGRFEVTVTGLSVATSLTGQEHDLIGLYGSPGRDEPVPYNPWYRNNNFKVIVRVFGAANVCSGCQAVGASKLELALCPLGAPGYIETACPAACVAAGYDFWQAYLGGGRGDALAWDAARQYRIAINWEPGRFTWTRGAEAPSSLTFPGTYAPRELRVRLGPPSNERGPDTRTPHGITFRDLVLAGERGAETPVCGGAVVPDAGPSPDVPATPDVPAPPPDRIGGCDPANPISAGDFAAPPAGEGGHFRVAYTHCTGASFRVVQFWVGERVATGLPNVSGGYENGRLFVGDSAASSCVPGEARTLRLPNGSLDCASTRVEPRGNDLLVEWAITLDPSTFAGDHGFFVDAKGGPGSPEPRLGWTRIGAYSVVRGSGGFDASTSADVVAPDGALADVTSVDVVLPDGALSDAASDARRRTEAGGDEAFVPTEPEGCGCVTQGRAARYDYALWVLALACVRFRRPRAGRRAPRA